MEDEIRILDSSDSIDSLISQYGQSQPDEIFSESEEISPEESATVTGEDVDIKITPKKARKRRGESKKSVDVVIPASVAIRVCSVVVGSIIGLAISKFAKKETDKDAFYLTEAEIESLEPVVSVLIGKYAKGETPESLFAYMAVTMYAGKILAAL